jgi:hypothetical protein
MAGFGSIVSLLNSLNDAIATSRNIAPTWADGRPPIFIPSGFGSIVSLFNSLNAAIATSRNIAPTWAETPAKFSFPSGFGSIVSLLNSLNDAIAPSRNIAPTWADGRPPNFHFIRLRIDLLNSLKSCRGRTPIRLDGRWRSSSPIRRCCQPEPSGSHAVDSLDREIVRASAGGWQGPPSGLRRPSGGPSVVRPPATLRPRPERLASPN